MATHSYDKYKSGYEKLLSTVQVKASWKSAIDRIAKQIEANKARYIEVQDAIGVPWQFVGVVHSLECGLSFAGHLHNGDSLKRRTRLVPKGYPKAKPANGVVYTWLESAIDALRLKELDKITDWSDSRVAYELERYNGWGYRKAGKPNSPYLWSGSNHYTKGKYVRDHVYDSNAVSQQAGAMLLYLRLKQETPVVLSKPEVKELKKTSKGFAVVRNARSFMRWLAGGISGLSLLEYMGYIKDFLTSWQGMLAIGLVLVGLWLVIEWLDSRKRKDVKEGRHVPSGEVKEDAELSS